jgi:hypothetical protein
MKLCLFLLTITILSCQLQSRQEEPRGKIQSPVSFWLVQNEDSLFRTLSEWVKIDTIQNKVDGELTSREYNLTKGIFDSLNDRIHSVDKCINIIFIFKPKEIPYFEILLTTEFDTTCVIATDSIFSDIDMLKHFKIVKYRPPLGSFSKYILETDTLDPNDIAVKLIQIDNKYDINIFLRKPTMAETKEQLKNDIFGEEILLKKVRSIKFQQLTDSVKGTKTLDEIRVLFSLKE